MPIGSGGLAGGGGSGSGGGGSISTIQSPDGTVVVTGGTGPTTSLSVFENTNQYFVDAYGADPTGVAFSDAAFAAAIAAAGATSPFQLVMGVGTYKLATGLTFIRLQSLVGMGSALTTINWTGSGACITQVDSSFNAFSSIAGPMTGFRVATTTQNGRIGLQYGDMLGIQNNDLMFQGFLGTGSIAYYGHNVAGWSEHGVHQVRVFNSTDAFIWDTGSFDYSFYNFYANIFAGTAGNVLTGRNGVQAIGVTLILNANCGISSANAGYLIGWDPAGGGTGTSVFQGAMFCHAETDGNAQSGPFAGFTGHIPIKMDSGSCQFSFEGTFEGLQGGSGATASAKWGASVIPGNANFSFTNRLNFNEVTPQLGQMALGDAQVTWGVSAQKELSHAGNLSGGMFLNGGGVHFYNLGATETFSVSAGFTTSTPTQKSFDVYFVCNNAGGCVATWSSMPGGTPDFPGNIPPSFSTVVGQVDHLKITWSPTLGKCIVEVLSYGGAAGAGQNISLQTGATYSLLLTDQVIVYTGSGIATAYLLPTAVGIQGKEYTLKNDSAFNLTITTTSAQTISGATTVTLGPGQGATVISDNANWRII